MRTAAVLLWVIAIGAMAPHAALAQTAPTQASAPARAQACDPPAARDDGWKIATPETVGLDPATLCALVPRFTAWTQADVHAVLVARHGALVFEHYFQGSDETWGKPLGLVDFSPDTKHDLRSITKSVTSLLLGIAIDRGWVPGVDTPVLSLLPAYADLHSPEKDRITLRHLLTMSAGLQWDENIPYTNPANSEILMDYAPDPYRFVLTRPVETPPGALWNYSGGGAALISAVLHQATGKTEDVLAQELLFDPLGIHDVEWVRYPANHEPAAASGLRMLPRSLIKLGQLVLNRGAWDGKQIVSPAWIDASITPQIQGPQLYFYGYQWWLGRSLVNQHQVDWAVGYGLGGQRLFVLPQLDMVVLVMAGLYHSDTQSVGPLVALNRFALAAVRPEAGTVKP
jgi:CubicO group peptidase (beta-lactamase class C family)